MKPTMINTAPSLQFACIDELTGLYWPSGSSLYSVDGSFPRFILSRLINLRINCLYGFIEFQSWPLFSVTPVTEPHICMTFISHIDRNEPIYFACILSWIRKKVLINGCWQWHFLMYMCCLHVTLYVECFYMSGSKKRIRDWCWLVDPTLCSHRWRLTSQVGSVFNCEKKPNEVFIYLWCRCGWAQWADAHCDWSVWIAAGCARGVGRCPRFQRKGWRDCAPPPWRGLSPSLSPHLREGWRGWDRTKEAEGTC